jgi:hypothetical protein
LSNNAESAILEVIESQKYGDAFYFWARMDQDPRNQGDKDFWSFCDAINAGNCRLLANHVLSIKLLYHLQIHGFNILCVDCSEYYQTSCLE